MKAIGIDFGLKRTGLAISDESRMFSFPLETIPSVNLMKRFIELKKEHSFTSIVLGFPTRFDDSDTHITENVRQLKIALEKQFETIEVVLIDERLTSKMASDIIMQSGAKQKKRRDKSLVDQVSASLILQSYLDQENT